MRLIKKVNVREAKAHLSRLLEEVAAGSEVIISRAGKPVARLTAIKPDLGPRKPGLLKGRISIAADFDAPLPDELLDSFDGRRK